MIDTNKQPEPISKSVIRNAYSLIMDGKAPIEIRKILKLSEREWFRINLSSYYHQLLRIGSPSQNRTSDGLKYIQGIELTLFALINQREKMGEMSDKRARISQQINELAKVYSGFNIYNY